MKRDRDDLLDLLTPPLGRPAAEALVDELEGVDVGALARREDIADLRTEMTQLGTDLRTEMTQLGTDLRTEIHHVRAELGHRIDLLATSMDGRFAAVDERFEGTRAHIEGAKNEVLAEIRGEITAAVTSQTRAVIVSMFANVAAVAGMAFAIARVA